MRYLRLDPRGATRGALVALALVAVATAGPAPAQQGDAKTVYLVLRAEPSATEDSIRKTLQKALKLSAATADDPLTVKAVSAGFFEEFQALVDKAGGTGVVDTRTGPVRLIPSRDVMYEIKLKPTQLLTELRVTYAKAGVKKYDGKGGGTALMLTAPGRYAFTPEAGDTPTKFDVDVAELGKKPETISDTWPQEDKFYVVSLRNFKGDQASLFDTLKNPKHWPNPFAVEKLQNDMVFAFASLKSEVARRKGKFRIAQNELIVTLDTLIGRDPKRVWVHLALRKDPDPSKDEVAAKLAEFRKFAPEQLVAEIRKGAVKVGDAAEITPDSPARWFEVPPSPSSQRPNGTFDEYERKIALADIPKLAEKYPNAWLLVVWEFDDGTTQSAIQTADENGTTTHVLAEELGEWSKKLKNAGAGKP